MKLYDLTIYPYNGNFLLLSSFTAAEIVVNQVMGWGSSSTHKSKIEAGVYSQTRGILFGPAVDVCNSLGLGG